MDLRFVVILSLYWFSPLPTCIYVDEADELYSLKEADLIKKARLIWWITL